MTKSASLPGMHIWSGLGVLGLLLVAAGCDKFSDAVPVYEEPMHQLVLATPEARVLDVRLPPADTSLFHVHAHDIFFAVLDGSKVWAESSTGGVAHVTWNAGYLGDNIEYSFGSKIHRVGNDGDTPFRLIAIENLRAATDLDPDSLGRVAALGEPAVEDVRFRAYQNVLNPGDSMITHGHMYPHLILQRTDGQIQLKSAASSESVLLARGEWYWEEPDIAHSYVNTGDSAVSVVEIEVR